MLTMWSVEGGMGIALEEPKACAECRAMHYFFVNRDGRTRCAGCDAKAQKDLRKVPCKEIRIAV